MCGYGTRFDLPEISNKQPDSILQFVFDAVMYPTEEVSDRGAEEYFIRQECFKVGSLLRSLVPANSRGALAPEQKSNVLLSKMGALSIGTDIVG